MRRHLWKIGLVLALMGAGAVALAALRAVSPDRLAVRIERVLSGIFDAPVHVGRAALSPRGRLDADGISAEQPGRPGWSLSIPHALADVPLDLALGRDAPLGGIRLDRAELVLRGDLARQDGARWRLPQLKPPEGATPDGITATSFTLRAEATGPGGEVRGAIRTEALDVLGLLRALNAPGRRAIELPVPLAVSASRSATATAAALAAEAIVRRGRVTLDGDAIALEQLKLDAAGVSWEPAIRLSGPAGARVVEARLLPTTLPARDLARGLAAVAGLAEPASITTGTVEVTAVVSGPVAKPEMAGEARMNEVAVTLPGEVGRLVVKRGSLIATPDPHGVLVTPQRLHMTLSTGGESRAVVLEKGDLALSAGGIKLHELVLRAAPGEAIATGAGGPPGPRLELKGEVARGPQGARVDVDARCDKADLRALAALADAALAAQMGKLDAKLTGDVALSVRGPLAGPEVRGPIVLGAGSLRLGADPRAPEATVHAGGKLELEGRTARLSGVMLTVRGLPVDATGSMSAAPAPRLDLVLATEKPPVREVLALFGADADLIGMLSGTFARVSLKLAGPPGASPAVALGLAGVKLAWPGLAEPATATAGEATVAGGKLTLTGVKLAIGKGTADLAGTIELASKKIELTLAGRPLPVELLARALPPGLALSGGARADLKITGTRAAPQIAGALGVEGLSVTWPGLAQPLAASKGSVEVTPARIALRGVELASGADRVKLDGELTRGAAVVARRVSLDGAIELGRLAWPEGLVVSGPAKLQARVSGDLTDPEITGRLTAKAARMTRGDRPLDLTDLEAEVAVEEGEVAVPRFRAKAMGARFEGSVEGDGRFALKGEGLDLKQLIASAQPGLWREGTLSFAVRGNSGGAVADLELDGNVAVDGLVMDMSQSRKLKSLKAKADASETGSALATGLLSTTGLSILAGASAAQAHFFAEVLDEALDVHPMGRVASPLKVRAGRLELAAIAGPNVKGQVAARLDTSQLEGKLEFIQVGQARFLDVAIAGTLSDPEPSVSATGVRLGGKGPPGGKNGGQSALNLKTLVKPGMGLLLGPVVPVADLLLPKLFGRKKRRRPRASPAPSPFPEPSASPD